MPDGTQQTETDVLLDSNGMLSHKRIHLRRFSGIEKGPLAQVRAIVVHQTDSNTETSTFAAYRSQDAGAHFLIAKDGTIYQTASVRSRCHHVGSRIRSRCLEMNGVNCQDAKLLKLKLLHWSARIDAINDHERQKAYPDRYPINDDSIGVELVGKSLDDGAYQAATPQQIQSLIWLVSALWSLFHIGPSDVYRHPEVSYKNPGEAASARWQ